MNESVRAWRTWLDWLDTQVPDDLLAVISIALLALVVLSKVVLLVSLRFRPSVLLASADACLLAWACSRISDKLLFFKTTPEHVILHYALAVYAVANLSQILAARRLSQEVSARASAGWRNASTKESSWHSPRSN